jgi:phenylpyruvate tautomerase PptA (4-oxalocrotonate tautomerase family)
MPMLDAFIPAGALAPEAEKSLLSGLTDLLIRHEGADPSNENVRSIAWVFLHRPETVFVGGSEPKAPRYRFITSVPEGQFDPERREAMVAALTEAVLDAEDGATSDPSRVRVFTPRSSTGRAPGASSRSPTSRRSPPATPSRAAATPRAPGRTRCGAARGGLTSAARCRFGQRRRPVGALVAHVDAVVLAVGSHAPGPEEPAPAADAVLAQLALEDQRAVVHAVVLAQLLTHAVDVDVEGRAHVAGKAHDGP